MHLCNCFQTIDWALLQTFYQSNWIWKVNRRLQFQKNPTHQCTKTSRWEKFIIFDEKIPKSLEFYYLEPSLVFTLPLRLLLMPRTFSFKKDRIKARVLSPLKCLEERKKLSYLAYEGSGVAFFSTDQEHIFGSTVGKKFGLILKGKGLHKPELAYDNVRTHLSWYIQTWLSTLLLVTQKLHYFVAFLLLRS